MNNFFKLLNFLLLTGILIPFIYSSSSNLETQINLLTELDEILWIEEILPNGQNLIDNSKIDININQIQNESTYNLSGFGVNIMQYEEYLPYSHNDMDSRINYPECILSPPLCGIGQQRDAHSTHVAGILISSGNSNINYTGIAPKSNLYSYRIGSVDGYNQTDKIEEDFLDSINNYDVAVISNSWGIYENLSNCDKYGDYTVTNNLIDSLILKNSFQKRVPIVWASGNAKNDGCSNDATITPHAVSKNVIAVGATYSQSYWITDFTSEGPTDDGRIKPDLVAPGCSYGKSGIISTNASNEYSRYIEDSIPAPKSCGTSFSAPMVSGTIALMLEQWNKQYTKDPLPSTIKALLLDSTKDLDNDGYGVSLSIDGPDYKNGYGLLNAKATIDKIINETFLEDNLTNQETKVYALNVSNQEELKVTLAWDDLPGNPALSSEGVLVNDLNLKLISPNGSIHYPWILDPVHPEKNATKGEDHLNNVEQVYISNPIAGEWLIIIDESNLEADQKFSLVSANKITTPTKLNNTDNIIGYWQGNNNNKDTSGNNNNAFLGSQVSYTQGKFDQAFDLPGTRDTSYLNLSINNVVKTISFWIKINQGSVTKYLVTNSDSQNPSTVINWQPDSTLDAKLGNGGYNFDSVGSLEIDRWYHLTYVSSNGVLKSYLNGKYLENISDINTLTETSLFFGRHPTPGYEIDAHLDEISIWSRPLSDLEIFKLYSSGLINTSIPTYQPVPIDSNLIGYWKGENNNQDSSGNNNDATLGSQVSYTSGKVGQAFDLPGTWGTSFLNLPINNVIKTISFWININQGGVTKYLVTNTGSQNPSTVINWQPDYTIDAKLGDGGYKFDSFGTISTNTWYHLTYVSTPSGLKYFLNGQYFGSTSDTNTLTETSLFFGRHPTPGYEIDAHLDEISIWSRELSNSEVERLYQVGIE